MLDFDSSLFLCGCKSYGFLWQTTDFDDHVASGALTSEFAAEIERLRAQHTDAVREKSAAENKSRRLTERLAAAEAEKGDLQRQLEEERRDANKAIADAQAAQVETKLARVEGSLAHQRAEELEVRLNGLRNRVDKAEASTRAEVEQTHAQFVDMYRELGARTAAFEAPDQEVGLRFLEWLQEELGVLPTIVTGLMSFASLVTCEGAMNALSREGWGTSRSSTSRTKASSAKFSRSRTWC
jgi:chromosome segregation ATPase